MIGSIKLNHVNFVMRILCSIVEEWEESSLQLYSFLFRVFHFESKLRKFYLSLGISLFSIPCFSQSCINHRHYRKNYWPEQGDRNTKHSNYFCNGTRYFGVNQTKCISSGKYPMKHANFSVTRFNSYFMNINLYINVVFQSDI